MEEVNELEDLQEQVKELEDRVYILERHESSRKIGKLIKTLITVFIIIGIGYGIIKAYNYVTNELPKVIDEKVKEIDVNKVIKNER